MTDEEFGSLTPWQQFLMHQLYLRDIDLWVDARGKRAWWFHWGMSEGAIGVRYVQVAPLIERGLIEIRDDQSAEITPAGSKLVVPPR